VKFSNEEKKEYAILENAARAYYQTFKANSKDELSRHYLKLTQKLTPMRIACAGGQIPLDDDAGDVVADEENDTDAEDVDQPKKGKKPQKFSDFAFTSKLLTLVNEMERVREQDSTGLLHLIVYVWKCLKLLLIVLLFSFLKCSEKPCFLAIHVDT
jgi:hypothetical protein